MVRSIMGRVRGMDPAARLIAVVALCLALGGTAYAAKAITGKNVKNNSLTGKDVKDGSLSPSDFSGSVRGEQGPQGPQGTPGTPGSGLAFAYVNLNGVLDAARSKNIASVQKAATTGYYCVNVSVPVVHAVASLRSLNGGEVSVIEGDPLTSCTNSADFAVQTFTSAGVAADKNFTVLFN